MHPLLSRNGCNVVYSGSVIHYMRYVDYYCAEINKQGVAS